MSVRLLGALVGFLADPETSVLVTYFQSFSFVLICELCEVLKSSRLLVNRTPCSEIAEPASPLGRRNCIHVSQST